jgi:hypothetical protein
MLDTLLCGAVLRCSRKTQQNGHVELLAMRISAEPVGLRVPVRLDIQVRQVVVGRS